MCSFPRLPSSEAALYSGDSDPFLLPLPLPAPAPSEGDPAAATAAASLPDAESGITSGERKGRDPRRPAAAAAAEEDEDEAAALEDPEMSDFCTSEGCSFSCVQFHVHIIMFVGFKRRDFFTGQR